MRSQGASGGVPGSLKRISGVSDGIQECPGRFRRSQGFSGGFQGVSGFFVLSKRF